MEMREELKAEMQRTAAVDEIIDLLELEPSVY